MKPRIQLKLDLAAYYNCNNYCINLFSGTELTKANLHTADGISVRFPRVTRIRTDKDWETATNLEELKHLYKTSKEKTDVSLLNKLAATADDEPPAKKMKTSPSKAKANATKPTKLSPKKTLDSFLIRKEVKPKVEKEIKLNRSSSSEKSIISMSTDVDMKEESNMSVDEIDSKEFLFIPESPLPDVFKDKRLGFYPDFISFTEDERQHFERHWIAYGGTVVKAIKSMDVDYVLHNNNAISFDKVKKLKKKVPLEVRHVHKDWLMQCINDVKLCDTKDYPVFITT